MADSSERVYGAMTSETSHHDFEKIFDSFKSSAFRLEALDLYHDTAEASDFVRYLAGEFFPESKNSEWCRWVQEQRTLGKRVQRVHVVSMPLTPYIKFEIDWRYIFNESAGEQIYLLDRSHLLNTRFPLADFWLFDNEVLFQMAYDSEGKFVDAQQDTDKSSILVHQELVRTLLSSSIPLRKFLSDLRTA